MNPNGSALVALETAMFRIARRLGRPAGHPGAVDKAGLAVLWALADGGESRSTDLAARLCLDPSTVSRQVRHLEDAGLVARSSDPDDGRAWRLGITAAGNSLLADTHAGRRAVLEEALAGWKPVDREGLTNLLTRLADDLDHLDAPLPARSEEKSA